MLSLKMFLKRLLQSIFSFTIHKSFKENTTLFNKDKISNIIIIRRDGIGDMICTLPLLRTVRKEFPDAHLAVLTEKAGYELLKDLSIVDEIFIWKRGITGLWKFKRQISTNFDLAISVKVGFSSRLACITYFTGARYRVGYIPNEGHILNFCYNIPAQNDGYPRHQIESCLRLLETIGISIFKTDISIPVDEPSRMAVKDSFDKQQCSNKIILCSVSCNRKEGRWKPEHFARLGDTLIKTKKIKYVLSWAPGDRWLAEKVASLMENKPILYETDTLKKFIALVASADLFIGSDGGAMHIAAGVGTPSIVLFCWTDENKWSPQGRHIILKKGRNVNLITVGDVIAAVEKFWN